MTSYEYADLAQSTFGNARTVGAVIRAFVSGYLVTTYLVGAKLTKFQVTVLTILFVYVMVFLAWSMSAYAYWGTYYGAQNARDVALAGYFRPGIWAVVLVAILNLSTVAMCLLLLRHVRTSRK